MRNMQYMVQFYKEYNKELSMVKEMSYAIAKLAVSQLGNYNFTLPIKRLN